MDCPFDFLKEIKAIGITKRKIAICVEELSSRKEKEGKRKTRKGRSIQWVKQIPEQKIPKRSNKELFFRLFN